MATPIYRLLILSSCVLTISACGGRSPETKRDSITRTTSTSPENNTGSQGPVDNGDGFTNGNTGGSTPGTPGGPSPSNGIIDIGGIGGVPDLGNLGGSGIDTGVDSGTGGVDTGGVDTGTGGVTDGATGGATDGTTSGATDTVTDTTGTDTSAADATIQQLQDQFAQIGSVFDQSGSPAGNALAQLLAIDAELLSTMNDANNAIAQGDIAGATDAVSGAVPGLATNLDATLATLAALTADFFPSDSNPFDALSTTLASALSDHANGGDALALAAAVATVTDAAGSALELAGLVGNTQALQDNLAAIGGAGVPLTPPSFADLQAALASGNIVGALGNLLSVSQSLALATSTIPGFDNSAFGDAVAALDPIISDPNASPRDQADALMQALTHVNGGIVDLGGLLNASVPGEFDFAFGPLVDTLITTGVTLNQLVGVPVSGQSALGALLDLDGQAAGLAIGRATHTLTTGVFQYALELDEHAPGLAAALSQLDTDVALAVGGTLGGLLGPTVDIVAGLVACPAGQALILGQATTPAACTAG